MGAKEKTIGGGSATPVADQWNRFLGGGLKNSQYQNNAVGNAINTALSGNIGADSNINNAQSIFANAQDMIKQGVQQAPQVGNHAFNMGPAPQLGGIDQIGSPGNIDISSWLNRLGGMDAVSQYQNNAPNVNTNISAQGLDQNLLAQLVQQLQAPQYQLPEYGTNTAAGNNAQALITKQINDSVANLRSRFAGQPGSRGTPGAYAESNFLASAVPTGALAVNDINNQRNQLDLQNAGLNINSILQAFGQNSQNLTNALGLQGQNAGLDLQAQGMNQQGQMFNAGNILEALKLNSQNLTNAGNMDLNAQNANMANALQAMLSNQQAQTTARGQDANYFSNLFNTNANVGMNNASNALTADQSNANNFLRSNELFSNNLFNAGNLGLGIDNNNLNLLNMNNNSMMSMLGNIFNSMNNVNALGTPQAQAVMAPSPFMNTLNGISGIVDMGSKIMAAGAGG